MALKMEIRKINKAIKDIKRELRDADRETIAQRGECFSKLRVLEEMHKKLVGHVEFQ